MSIAGRAIRKIWEVCTWKVCAVWALLLGLIIFIRPHLFPVEVVLPEGALPPEGLVLELPETVTNVSGQIIPALATEGTTLFLVTSAGCPASRRALEERKFHDLLLSAEKVGLASRLLVIPAGDDDTEWYMDRVPSSPGLVLDTLGFSLSMLETRVTPSVVLVAPDGTVRFAKDWPVTWKAIEGELAQ